MSTKPRTPEYFPRMRVRGGRRRANLRSSQQSTAVKWFTSVGWDYLGVVLRDMWQGIVVALQSVGEALVAPSPLRKSDFALSPGPLDPPVLPSLPTIIERSDP